MNFLNKSRLFRDSLFLPLVKKIPDNISPDYFCYFRFGLGILMGILIFMQIPHLVLVCFLIWLVGKFTDCIDGTLARLRQTGSWRGRTLDAVSDRFVLFFLAWAAYTVFPLASGLYWAMVFIIFMFTTDFIRTYFRNKGLEESAKEDLFWDLLEIIFRAVFSAIFLVQYLYYY